jgi:ATP-dependent Clp protease protease subunit
MTIFERLSEIAAKAPVAKPTTIVARKGDEATLWIYDAISPPGFGGVTARDVVDALAEADGAKTINIRINSPGGAVYDAKAIYAALMRHPAHKVAHIDGLAASAATFIAMAADKIITAPEATWFVHNAQGVAMGDAAVMRETAELLDMESDNIRAIYAKRTGQSDADLRAWMDAETFMNAAEAKVRGFTDEIAGEDEEEDKRHKIAAAVPRLVSLAAETRSRIALHREEQVKRLRKSQERSAASGGSVGQPTKK